MTVSQWLQDLSPVLVPAGVVLGAGIALTASLWTARINRKAARAESLFDKRNEAYIGMIDVLLRIPVITKRQTPQEARDYFALIPPWIEQYNQALAPLYAYASARIHNYVVKGRAIVQGIALVGPIELDRLDRMFAQVDADNSDPKLVAKLQAPINQSIDSLQEVFGHVESLAKALLAMLRAELSSVGN